MQFKSYAKSLAVAVSLAVMAGCSSTGGSQDGSMDGTGTAGGVAGQGMANGQASGTQLGQGQGYGQGQGQGIPDQRTIYFDYDRDTIRPEFESVLNAHAQYLRSNPNASVILQGHADERGTREYNLGLGERRAQSVEQFLTVQGVSPSQLEIVSYGEERPAVEGHSEQSYAQNRRVVFDY
ncbi:peptidoglycan-associated lipoprotein Pal [Halomonas sp. McH1-25]|uniref:peptidoglycan-associated lipoprotein Pal n=1 Tax=unclassified Halomonas TaxID=2609666 RepID=UPI001EF3F78B|nr:MULTISPECIES: peptidoglycan-associated lipoprotein Pal [unclassified Halomonas]MCG7598494.1 peptidoglycan-associated lipoprotein Pal [Halomonas sp. McH1-25]MCP1341746.1 peptidoglycan-associated lipoprotein Pal [Halomonas sp. FL8]MCP1361911.1 peptidoglycan-associated lipoprotein Pal [Halomonas sp. BBD45]MCP1364133.1 peptidoglycan-associated lipoprotein Pal [Halomonas sp. BBD48]